MARAKAKTARTSGTPRATRRSARNRHLDDAPNDGVPDVFQDMLAETAPPASDEPRPSKKRKVANVTERVVPQSPVPPVAARTSVDRGDDIEKDEDTPRLQTIIDESESDDSDMDWEDVNLDPNNADYLLQPLGKDQEEETLQIEVGKDYADDKPARRRRKAVTAAERATRLHVHKMHVLCLLYHSHIRNAWCNDDKVQTSLKRFRSVKINTLFMPNPDQSQLQASKAFTDGLTLAKDAWKKFKITSVGMRRAKWAHDAKDLEVFKISDDADPVMEVSDFRKAAIAFEGSADTGAMLFCAFLRALGVETRLVCSLQPLPFAATAQPPADTSPNGQGSIVYAENDNSSKATPSSEPAPLKRITRIGRPGLSSSSARQAPVPSPVKPKKPIPHPRYPVYWVEAFNAAQQTWVPVDPIATGTVGQPSRLEPPLSDPDVSLAYAVAFEDSGVAKDVTRRYAKAYSAKTLRTRIEATDAGDRWWRKALKLFRRRTILDRDQLESAALARRAAQEPMPKNVQDYKHHPHYALARHLRHNQAIHPLHPIGQLNVGSAAVANLEPVYRRRDVHVLRSATRWFLLGREIVAGAQPLRRARGRRTGAEGDEEEGEGEGNGLYAAFQTEPYVAPPVVNGRVPRNAFGNIDLHTPAMLPAGGAHLRHALAGTAARILGIDAVPAVTGFRFRGRRGTAVVEGVVVGEEYVEAVGAVVEGLEEGVREEEEERRRRVAVGLWGRWVRALGVVERVRRYESVAERAEREREEDSVREREVEREKERWGEEMAGGFLLAEGAGVAPAEPTAGRMVAAAGGEEEEEYYDDGAGGGFLPDESGGDEGAGVHDLFKSQIMDAAPLRPPRSSSQQDDFSNAIDDDDEPMDGGGFMPDEPEQSTSQPDKGGGFIVDEDEGGGGFVAEEAIPDDDGGGFVQQDADKEEDDAAAVGSPITAVVEPSSVEVEPDVGLAELGARQMETRALGDAATETAANVAEPEVQEQSASDDEMDSLPSHDPEDDDAEPEWLAEEVVSE